MKLGGVIFIIGCVIIAAGLLSLFCNVSGGGAPIESARNILGAGFVVAVVGFFIGMFES